MSIVDGLVLAAGGGRRMGRPKALLTLPSGMTYLEAACRVLLDAGCGAVVVVLGAGADEARQQLRAARLPGVHEIVNRRWDEGLAASLRAGLEHLATDSHASSVVIHLVDLPDVGPDVVRRLITRAGTGAQALARAAYAGVPGHPVLLGRPHWSGVLAAADGDQGARDYLRDHPPRLVEVGDLASGRDVDTPADRQLIESDRPGESEYPGNSGLT